jgi:hypothetical protein
VLEKILSRPDPAWQAEIDPSRLLWVGVDISSCQHEACVWTSARVLRRRLAIANTRDGPADAPLSLTSMLESTPATQLTRPQGPHRRLQRPQPEAKKSEFLFGMSNKHPLRAHPARKFCL